MLFHSPQGRTWFLLYRLPITNIPLNSPSRKFDNFNYHGARVVSRIREILRFSSVKKKKKTVKKKEGGDENIYREPYPSRSRGGVEEGKHSVDTPQSAL